jgi:putrescine---pyruvate transaminase
MTHLWRGMATMAQSAGREIVIARGRGATIWDREGNEYLDATASLWYCNVGHGRPEIARAITRQLERIESFHTFDVYANEPALELAERISAIAPMPDARVFLTPGGGSDAVDSACKLARRYWSAVGRPEKTVIVARRHAYHGMNGYGTSVAGIEPNREGFGELIREVELVEWDSVDELRAVLARNGHRIAAFIGEPVIGAGGLYPPPDGYWRAVAAACREHDVLFISDEVICGFGRLGRWFGCEYYGVEPDLMTCAKGLTSGYLPLGAVIASDRVAAPFWQGEDAPMLRHGYTYAGHPVSCAAALANLDILESEGLVERVRDIAPRFQALLVETFADCDLVGPIRGAGLLAAVPIEDAALAHEPTLPLQVAARSRERGCMVRGLSGAIQLSPPFVITDAEMELVATRLRAAFDDVAAELTSAVAIAPAAR